MRRWLSILVLVLVSGCAGWVRMPEPPAANPAAFKHYEIWVAGEPIVLQALEVDTSSLSGIPVSGAWCDSCRVRLSLAEIDSVRTATGGSEISTGFGVVGGFVGVFSAVVMLVFLIEGYDLE